MNDNKELNQLAKISIVAYRTEVSQGVMPLMGHPMQKWLNHLIWQVGWVVIKNACSLSFCSDMSRNVITVVTCLVVFCPTRFP